MKTKWTSHLKTEDEKERFKKSVLSSRHVLDRLIEIVDDELKEIDNIETGVDIYERPGWDALLAHYNGEKASLKRIKALIDLDKRN